MRFSTFYHLAVLLACLLTSFAFAEKIDGNHEADNAQSISQIKVANSPKGFFFRGDSRSPTHPEGRGIFDIGFHPQGHNSNLNAHLNFHGNSGYVSTSRSDIAAQRYMFGRTGSHTEEGYLYVISPENLPDGYWIPGIYTRDPAVQMNQEFSVYGNIPPQNIAGAFHYTYSEQNPIEWIPNPHYHYARTSPYNPSRDGFFQDICGAIAGIAAYLCIKPHYD